MSETLSAENTTDGLDFSPPAEVSGRAASIRRDLGAAALNYPPLPDMNGLSHVELMKQVDKIPLLSRQEHSRLGYLVQAGDTAARDTMVMRNLRMVHTLVRRFTGYGVPEEDLFQYGVIGLIRAVEKFDPNRGLALSTSATRWIMQAMLRATINSGRTIRLPDKVHYEVRRMLTATKQLRDTYGRTPTDTEIAQALGLMKDESQEEEERATLHVAEMRVWAGLNSGISSLDEPKPVGDGSQASRDGAVAVREVAVMIHTGREVGLLDVIEESLTLREALIVGTRFGVFGFLKVRDRDFKSKTGVTVEEADEIIEQLGGRIRQIPGVEKMVRAS